MAYAFIGAAAASRQGAAPERCGRYQTRGDQPCRMNADPEIRPTVCDVRFRSAVANECVARCTSATFIRSFVPVGMAGRGFHATRSSSSIRPGGELIPDRRQQRDRRKHELIIIRGRSRIGTSTAAAERAASGDVHAPPAPWRCDARRRRELRAPRRTRTAGGSGQSSRTRTNPGSGRAFCRPQVGIDSGTCASTGSPRE